MIRASRRTTRHLPQRFSSFTQGIPGYSGGTDAPLPAKADAEYVLSWACWSGLPDAVPLRAPRPLLGNPLHESVY